MGKWSGKQAATHILKTIFGQATNKVFFLATDKVICI